MLKCTKLQTEICSFKSPATTRDCPNCKAQVCHHHRRRKLYQRLSGAWPSVTA